MDKVRMKRQKAYATLEAFEENLTGFPKLTKSLMSTDFSSVTVNVMAVF